MKVDSPPPRLPGMSQCLLQEHSRKKYFWMLNNIQYLKAHKIQLFGSKYHHYKMIKEHFKPFKWKKLKTLKCAIYNMAHNGLLRGKVYDHELIGA